MEVQAIQLDDNDLDGNDGNQLTSSEMKWATTKINANDRGKPPTRAPSGLYERARRPRKEKAPIRNPHATLRTNNLGTDM